MTTFILIVLAVLLAYAVVVTAFVVKQGRTLRAFRSELYDTVIELHHTQSRLEGEIGTRKVERDDMIKRHKHLDEVVAGIEIALENLSVCPVSSAIAPDEPREKRPKRTYSEAFRNMLVQKYYTLKAANTGITITSLAELEGVPRRTLSNWLKVTDGQNAADKG